MSRRPPNRTEERVSAAVHGVGLVLAALAFILLLAAATPQNPRSGEYVIAAWSFGGTAAIAMLASTLHHGARTQRTKRGFLLLDHAGIYLLIAGTYTPFALILPIATGFLLLTAQWLLALLGIWLQSNDLQRGDGRWMETASPFFYMAMGWGPVMLLGSTVANAVPSTAFWLLLAGGCAYTIGVMFHQAHQMRFHHAIWHGWVLVGLVLHFLAIRDTLAVSIA